MSLIGKCDLWKNEKSFLEGVDEFVETLARSAPNIVPVLGVMLPSPNDDKRLV